MKYSNFLIMRRYLSCITILFLFAKIPLPSYFFLCPLPTPGSFPLLFSGGTTPPPFFVKWHPGTVQVWYWYCTGGRDGGGRDKYNSRSTDKIRTLVSCDRPYCDKWPVESVLLFGCQSHCFLVLARALVVTQSRQRKPSARSLFRRSRNGSATTTGSTRR